MSIGQADGCERHLPRANLVLATVEGDVLCVEVEELGAGDAGTLSKIELLSEYCLYSYQLISEEKCINRTGGLIIVAISSLKRMEWMARSFSILVVTPIVSIWQWY